MLWATPANGPKKRLRLVCKSPGAHRNDSARRCRIPLRNPSRIGGFLLFGYTGCHRCSAACTRDTCSRYRRSRLERLWLRPLLRISIGRPRQHSSFWAKKETPPLPQAIAPTRLPRRTHRISSSTSISHPSLMQCNSKAASRKYFAHIPIYANLSNEVAAAPLKKCSRVCRRAAYSIYS